MTRPDLERPVMRYEEWERPEGTPVKYPTTQTIKDATGVVVSYGFPSLMIEWIKDGIPEDEYLPGKKYREGTAYTIKTSFHNLLRDLLEHVYVETGAPQELDTAPVYHALVINESEYKFARQYLDYFRKWYSSEAQVQEQALNYFLQVSDKVAQRINRGLVRDRAGSIVGIPEVTLPVGTPLVIEHKPSDEAKGPALKGGLASTL